MRWTPGGRSKNLEDMRGASSGGGGGGGFGGGGGGGRRLGLGGLVVLIVLSVIFKQDLITGSGGLSDALPASSGGRPAAPLQDSLEENAVQFMSSVLDSAQIGWSRTIDGYRDAKLVLFRDAIESACGFAESATGPFYCPGDQKVYIDLAFFDQLDRQFGAPGDFAQAYVLAHEIGHHVQNLMGTERQLRAAQQQNPSAKNRLSVAMELQADCYAGVWAYSAARNGQLERGDLEEGLSAASAVGDDRLQKMGSGRVNPESFTHGSSAERMRWFKRGFDAGDPRQCDTFANVR
ncbi:MAG: neutral zinc metallopeptidase [Gemmatimonadaceae bacterium]|jgi:predicted metalloprotease|nr:neutral zinc metallopeptidase [Gemmatimonadaceae bacterium]MCC6432974.1 neutral zinc metallopeptidase [Gemmatimonadaceae bacterium]